LKNINLTETQADLSPAQVLEFEKEWRTLNRLAVRDDGQINGLTMWESTFSLLTFGDACRLWGHKVVATNPNWLNDAIMSHFAALQSNRDDAKAKYSKPKAKYRKTAYIVLPQACAHDPDKLSSVFRVHFEARGITPDDVDTVHYYTPGRCHWTDTVLFREAPVFPAAAGMGAHEDDKIGRIHPHTSACDTAFTSYTRLDSSIYGATEPGDKGPFIGPVQRACIELVRTYLIHQGCPSHMHENKCPGALVYVPRPKGVQLVKQTNADDCGVLSIVNSELLSSPPGFFRTDATNTDISTWARMWMLRYSQLCPRDTLTCTMHARVLARCL
jgi:hypothetical protein